MSTLSSHSLPFVGAPGMQRHSHCFLGCGGLSNRTAAQRGSLGAVAPPSQFSNCGVEVRLALERIHQRRELRQTAVEEVRRRRSVHQAVEVFFVDRAIHRPEQRKPAVIQTQWTWRVRPAAIR